MWRLAVAAMVLLSMACSKRSKVQTLVTNDLAFFEKYAPECERWLETNYSCKKADCFTSVALEIVGIDTFSADTQIVYAWCWMQEFRMLDSIHAGNMAKFTPVRFLILPTGRSFSIAEAFLPDPEKPLKEELLGHGFPDFLVKIYFINQSKEVEIERVKMLSEKAKDKYRMYLEKAYMPEAAPAE